MPFTTPLDEMTMDEKLADLGALWEHLFSLPDDKTVATVPADVSHENPQQSEAGETQFISWEEAQKRIRELMAQRRAAGEEIPRSVEEPDFLARAKLIWGDNPPGIPLSELVSEGRGEY